PLVGIPAARRRHSVRRARLQPARRRASRSLRRRECAMTDALLSVRDLSVDFSVYGARSQVLRGVSLEVPARRHVALVGESGCGKSVTMRAIMGLLTTPLAKFRGGEIRFDGANLLRLSGREREALRGTAMSMVFQDPTSSLNP